ncbi:MAG: sigma-70 family RNA polymerase sigma factor [Actinomycetota bacterium]|nr:sigma-70 family RNA polymerase sigma factor [Actinomycetota bacterium]
MTGAWGAGPLEPSAGPGDESLLAGARAGEPSAVEHLYAAHVASARRLATILAGPETADELVAEAFARVLAQLRAGRGPTTNFRAYLHTTIRNIHRDTFRGAREVPASDRPWLLDVSESPIDELIEGLDANGATAALASLPGTWQQVLWHLEVEGRKPAEIAQLLSTTPAVVSSLAYRAREGLRRAFLDQYAGPVPKDADCRWTRARLSQYVRDDLSARAATKVADHLADCAACATAHTEMAQLNTQIAAYLFPVVLVGGMHALDRASDAAVGAGVAEAPGRLVTELAARAEGTPTQDAATGAASSGSEGRAGLSGRVSAAAAAVALVAITATAFALTGDDGDPSSAPDDMITTGESSGGPPPATPTPSPARLPDVSPSRSAPTTGPGAPVVATPVVPVPGVTAPTVPATTNPTAPAPTSLQPTAPPPTSTPPVPDPQSVEVLPMAPSATPITRCGTHGSLRMPQTQGVRYSLVVGDGREGPWVVVATAESGYEIRGGSATRFSGDLGRFEPCPVPLAIREVSTRSTGDAVRDPWVVTVTPSVPDQERRALSVTYWFDSPVLVVRREGAGWACRGPGGAELGAGSSFEAGARLTCDFHGRGPRPSPVSLVVRAVDGSGSAVQPSGTAALSADGDVVDIEDFDSVDR